MPATKFPTINGLADMPMAKSEASENWAGSRWSGDFVFIKDVLTSKSPRRVRVITVDLWALHWLKSVFLPQLILNADAKCGLATGIQIWEGSEKPLG
jgi:hypothetical protein